MRIVYFAHCMLDYNTEKERKELELIETWISYKLVFNPNRRSIQQAKKPMQACFDVLKDPSVDSLVFSTSLQNTISLGVYAEIRYAQKHNMPVYIIQNGRIMSFKKTLNLIKHSKNRDWAKI